VSINGGNDSVFFILRGSPETALAACRSAYTLQ
jgi:hypothetical protein